MVYDDEQTSAYASHEVVYLYQCYNNFYNKEILGNIMP